MTTQITVAEAATRYVAAGWPVHPLHDTTAGHCSCQLGADCQQPGKHPRTTHGFHDATTDAKTVAAWWRRWPQANIGVPGGPLSRLAVVDLDGDAGATAWQALTADDGHTPTATAITPHGRHLWYRLPDGIGVRRSIRRLGDGIDVLGDDGYAIAPPSIITVCPKPHDDDQPCRPGYTWTSVTRQLAPLPSWIPTRLEQLRTEHATDDRDAPRPQATRARRPTVDHVKHGMP